MLPVPAPPAPAPASPLLLPTRTSPSPRLMYVDDSGSVPSGLVVYGWIECRTHEWNLALRALLHLRKRLYSQYGVPTDEELHATKFVNGRNRISTFSDNLPPSRLKPLGRAVAEACLAALAATEQLSVGSAFWRTDATGSAYYAERARAYRILLTTWDASAKERDDFAFVNMDGDGSDTSYHSAHRELALESRRIIEDPHFHDSRRSQFVQMADLVAYSAFVHLNRHQGNRFGWQWYATYFDEAERPGRTDGMVNLNKLAGESSKTR